MISHGPIPVQGALGNHHTRIRTTNILERLFEEVKRKTRVVGVFSNETSATTFATVITVRGGLVKRR
jgi:transposase-like protein